MKPHVLISEETGPNAAGCFMKVAGLFYGAVAVQPAVTLLLRVLARMCARVSCEVSHT